MNKATLEWNLEPEDLKDHWRNCLILGRSVGGFGNPCGWKFESHVAAMLSQSTTTSHIALVSLDTLRAFGGGWFGFAPSPPLHLRITLRFPSQARTTLIVPRQ